MSTPTQPWYSKPIKALGVTIGHVVAFVTAIVLYAVSNWIAMRMALSSFAKQQDALATQRMKLIA